MPDPSRKPSLVLALGGLVSYFELAKGQPCCGVRLRRRLAFCFAISGSEHSIRANFSTRQGGEAAIVRALSTARASCFWRSCGASGRENRPLVGKVNTCIAMLFDVRSLSTKYRGLEKPGARENSLGASLLPEYGLPVEGEPYQRLKAPSNTPERTFETEGGGESGIRTHGTVSRTHAFQACALSHSAISPERPLLKGRR